MLGFMDYIQNAFYTTTNWDRDNSYGRLTATSKNLLDFAVPEGLRFNVSSLSSPHFASSYTVNTIGLIDGSLSYLYTSRALDSLPSRSNAIDLRSLIHGYRRLRHLRSPPDESWFDTWRTLPSPKNLTLSTPAKQSDSASNTRAQCAVDQSTRPDTLLYGRLFLPNSTLEALYMRQLHSTAQLKISCVSDARLPNGGSLLAHLQHDVGKHCTEYIYSTDGALFGFRGLYNFGAEKEAATGATHQQQQHRQDQAHRAAVAGQTGVAVGDPESIITPAVDTASPSSPSPSSTSATATSTFKYGPPGRLSAGGEIYYGLLNKSGGASTGMRFTTLPSYTGFPYTMTLTLNPLMGNLSSTYSVLASPLVALSSRFSFNAYSYESELQLGAELWRPAAPKPDINWARAKLGLEPIKAPVPSALASKQQEDWSQGMVTSQSVSGCLKARIDQRGVVGLLWEGQVKEVLYTCGTTIDLQGGENMFRGIGVEVHYSS